MLGRTDERALLAERLGALQDGMGALVMVEGEPGIGKSRLVADLLQRAQARSVRSLSGAGDAIEEVHAVSRLASRLHRTHGFGRRR